MKVALDEIAEHRAEAAAGTHAVEDALRQPHPLRRNGDRERVVIPAPMCEVDVAQQGSDLGLVDRRRVEKTRIVGCPPQRSRLAGNRAGDQLGGSRRSPSTQPYPPTTTPAGAAARNSARRRVATDVAHASTR